MKVQFPKRSDGKAITWDISAKVDKTWKDIWGTEGFSKGCGDWVIYQVLPWGAPLSWLTELVEPDLTSAHSSVLQEVSDRVSWSSLMLRRFIASSQFVQHNQLPCHAYFTTLFPSSPEGLSPVPTIAVAGWAVPIVSTAQNHFSES